MTQNQHSYVDFQPTSLIVLFNKPIKFDLEYSQVVFKKIVKSKNPTKLTNLKFYSIPKWPPENYKLLKLIGLQPKDAFLLVLTKMAAASPVHLFCMC